jgi:hypothetical protein
MKAFDSEQGKNNKQMNIKRLLKMARSENPSRILADLSMQWAHENKSNNPVRDALTLIRFFWFMVMDIILLLIWAAITLVWNPQISLGEGKNLWVLVGVMIIILIPALVLSWPSLSVYLFYSNVSRFIRGISVLENIIGRPMEQWTSDEYFMSEACTHLNELAQAVQTAETADAEEVACRPWVESPDKRSKPARDLFESHFLLLTTLLPIKKDRGYYYPRRNKS